MNLTIQTLPENVEMEIGTCRIRVDKDYVAEVKVFFKLVQRTHGGFLKGMLRVEDPDLVLHDKRVLLSPYRNSPERVPQSMHLHDLVSVEERKFEADGDFVADYLLTTFLEKLKPII